MNGPSTGTTPRSGSSPAERRSFFLGRLGRALVAVSVVILVDSVVTSVPHRVGAPEIAAWVAAAAFLAAYPIAYRRPEPGLLVWMAIAGVVLAFTAGGNAPFIAVVATIAIAAIRLPPQYSRPISVLTGVGYLAGVIVSAHFSRTAAVSTIAGLLFTYVAGDSIRRLREEQRRTQALLQEVIEGRDARVRAAALDERARLAREMHDILAHTLSALAIQLEGARMLAEQRPDDPSLLERMERAGRLTREGLEEVKRAVGSLRGDTLPGPDLLPRLARDFEEDTGIPVTLEVEGTAQDLPSDGRLALYRVAQEALTNVRKHADATAVDICLRYGEKGVDLTVENAGKERPAAVPSGGFGLNGMRERAELLGGRLEAGPSERGFRVHLWIPT